MLPHSSTSNLPSSSLFHSVRVHPSIFPFSWHSVICHRISKSAYFGCRNLNMTECKMVWMSDMTSRKEQETAKKKKLVVHNFSFQIFHFYTSPLQQFFHVFCCSFFFSSHFWLLMRTLCFSWPSHRLAVAGRVWRTLAPFLSG